MDTTLPEGLTFHCDECKLVIPADSPRPAGAECASVARAKLSHFYPDETRAAQHAMATATWSLIHRAANLRRKRGRGKPQLLYAAGSRPQGSLLGLGSEEGYAAGTGTGGSPAPTRWLVVRGGARLMALTRTEHWRTREFYQFLLAHQHDAFAWGKCDCCLIAADAIQAFTGTDIADDFRGKYTDQSTAFILIETVTGGTTVADAAAWCATKHGLSEYLGNDGKPRPLFAQSGDLVVVPNGDTLIAGVVHLNGREVVSIGEGGLMLIPLSLVQRAWKV